MQNKQVMLPLACSLACTWNWRCVLTATCSFAGRPEQDDVFWQTDVQQLNHWCSNEGKREQILMTKNPRGKIPCNHQYCQPVIPPCIPSLPHLQSHDTQYLWLDLCTLIGDISENSASLRMVVLEVLILTANWLNSRSGFQRLWYLDLVVPWDIWRRLRTTAKALSFH